MVTAWRITAKLRNSIGTYTVTIFASSKGEAKKIFKDQYFGAEIKSIRRDHERN